MGGGLTGLLMALGVAVAGAAGEVAAPPAVPMAPSAAASMALPAAVPGAGSTARAAAPAAAPAHRAAVVTLPGEDKFRHFWLSYGATSLGFGVASAVDGDRALPAAVAAAAVVGLVKELQDRGRGGVFDPADLVANAAGIAAAYFVLREIR